MCNIALAAGEKIVQADDLVAFAEQGIAQVRADEPCASGDQYPHRVPFSVEDRIGQQEVFSMVRYLRSSQPRCVNRCIAPRPAVADAALNVGALLVVVPSDDQQVGPRVLRSGVTAADAPRGLQRFAATIRPATRAAAGLAR